MARPVGWVPYKTKDGVECPSVRTILSAFRDPGPLMWWAHNEGKAGRDYRQTRDDASDAGTFAHAMVEADIHGKPIPTPPDNRVGEKAARAYQNYRAWADRTQLKPIEAEVRLVSEKHRFGGTMDALMIGGKLSIGDLKTSGSVYAEHLSQVAAYKLLFEENFPDRPIEGGYHILRISREEGDFAHHYFDNLDDAAELFLLLRRAFDLTKKLKARVR
jgi:hypothetical protein